MSTTPPPDGAPHATGRSADRDHLVEILTQAFDDDPLYRWLFAEPTIRRPALRDNFAMVIDACAATGHLDVAPGGDAAAIWTAPGRALLEEPSALLAVLSRWASSARIAAAGRGMAACSRHQPIDAAVVHLIGVHPDRAGTGIGSTLIRRRLVELDRAGLTAYLESSNPRNHTFYARHGFLPIAEVPLGAGGPRVTCMVRPASTSS
jgi:GNAT superfamily N-acetyltransferase